jgi:hypothetical protein
LKNRGEGNGRNKYVVIREESGGEGVERKEKIKVRVSLSSSHSRLVVFIVLTSYSLKGKREFH